jgi:hypothetical protein
MLPIRSRRILLGLVAATMLPGCVIEHRLPPPEPVNNTPIVSDQAMSHRDWNAVPAHYTNDTVIAFDNYSPLKAKNARYSALVETPLFIANMFYTAYGVFIIPPWEMVPWKSMTMEPTYTAMPPMPPTAAK